MSETHEDCSKPNSDREGLREDFDVHALRQISFVAIFSGKSKPLLALQWQAKFSQALSTQFQSKALSRSWSRRSGFKPTLSAKTVSADLKTAVSLTHGKLLKNETR